MREGREAITPDLQPRPSAGASHKRLSVPANKTSSGVRSSATWTSTSGDLGGLSDTDEIGDRQDFVEEYNRIAKKVCFAGLWRQIRYLLIYNSMAFVHWFPTTLKAWM